MGFYDLFNAQRPARIVSGTGTAAGHAGTSVGPAGGAGPEGPVPAPASAPATREGTFVTPQSLTTFAGASMVVALLWKTSGVIDASFAHSSRAAFGCALLVGLILFAISESDPARGKLATRDYLIDGFVALVNVLVLFSAAVGATEVVR